MPGVTYQSTRGGEAGKSFEYVVLRGLAGDKGLFVPEAVPRVQMVELEGLRGRPWTDVMFYVLSKYIGREEIPAADLKDLVERSAATFRHPDVTPVTVLDEGTKAYILELFHGPTFAFKDVALQLLGNLFEYFLERRGPDSTLTILGATSGDTGPAAIHGLRGKKGVDCFILYPKGRTSPLQERQMTTVLDANVHCIGIDGSFDDAQALVKAAFGDAAFRDEVHLGAINSINWARVLAQMSYYFWAYLAVTDRGDALSPAPTRVDFSVPTGNFGDVLAGYYARAMGLPVGTLLVATNENDILHRFFQDGKYWREDVQPTIAPSMDICVSSNFERFLFHLCGNDSDILRFWMNDFASTGKLTLSGDLLERARGAAGFTSCRVDTAENLENIQEVYTNTSERHLLCPHASIGVAAARRELVGDEPDDGSPPRPVVSLATAHWAKFPDAVSRAVTLLPAAPAELAMLEEMDVKSYDMKPDLKLVQGFMREHMTNGGGLAAQLGLSRKDLITSVGVGLATTVAALAIGLLATGGKRR